jgi:hypothetical protein
MATLPREVLTGYADQGLIYAQQLQKKLVDKYVSLPFNHDVFNQIIADIKIDVEVDNLQIIEPKVPLNPDPYPNWLKILYQVVTRIGRNFEEQATISGFQQGMTFLQLHELLFQNFPNLITVQNQP